MRVARSVSIAILWLLMACDRRSTPRDTGPGVDVTYLDTMPADVSIGPDARMSADSGGPDAAVGPDAGRDASSMDARPPSDASARDARADDARVTDARVTDARVTDARATDARATDARATDAPAPSPDAPMSDGGGGAVVIECAPPVPSSASGGLVFSTMFWPGFRFEVRSSSRVTAVGLQLTPSTPGTVSAAIVRLSGPSDTPDAPDLTGADVLVRTDVTLPASSTPIIARGAVDFTLGAGWYALVFAAGAHGATSSGGSLPSAGGGGCRSTPASGFPFSIRQSDGMFILQGAEPHLFVEIAP